MRTSVLKVEFHLTSKDFLLCAAEADCAMILLARIYSSFPFMLLNTYGSTEVSGDDEFLVGVLALKIACIYFYYVKIAWDN